jgi:hypothetical protein
MFLVVGVIVVYVGLFLGLTLWASGGTTAGHTGH